MCTLTAGSRERDCQPVCSVRTGTLWIRTQGSGPELIVSSPSTPAIGWRRVCSTIEVSWQEADCHRPSMYLAWQKYSRSKNACVVKCWLTQGARFCGSASHKTVWCTNTTKTTVAKGQLKAKHCPLMEPPESKYCVWLCGSVYGATDDTIGGRPSITPLQVPIASPNQKAAWHPPPTHRAGPSLWWGREHIGKKDVFSTKESLSGSFMGGRRKIRDSELRWIVWSFNFSSGRLCCIINIGWNVK